MIKVLINGANGKMGAMIADIIAAEPELGMQVIAKRDENNKEENPCDIIIDFSLPAGAQEAYQLAKKYRAAFLTGTTNLSQDFIDTLKAEKEIPVFYSPNVSIGVFMFTKLIKQAAEYFNGYKQFMHEIHHAQKKDAPSGTAKSLAAAVNFPTAEVTYERIGTVPGTHSFKLVSQTEDEEITLTHRAIDRKLFAQSAAHVAAWLAKQKPGFYDMNLFTESFL